MFLVNIALFLFFSCIVAICLRNFIKLFTPSYGRRHRLCGLLYLIWLLFGLMLTVLNDNVDSSGKNSSNVLFHFFASIRDAVVEVSAKLNSNNSSGNSSWIAHTISSAPPFLLYDVTLGVLGTVLTLTAAFDFKNAHLAQRVRNKASGAIDKEAVVSFEEMIEHAFYQVLNLLQVSFLHFVAFNTADSAVDRTLLNLAAFSLVVAPWAVRHLFPTHSFSKNYSGETATQNTFEKILYRVKKWQYVFQKHFILHALNITAALSPSSSHSPLVTSNAFRVLWLVMNAAFVFEFFLQTLVKKHFIEQRTMLFLNTFLTAVGTVGAAPLVLFRVDWIVGFVSVYFNFTNRGHDVANVVKTTVFAVLLLVYGGDLLLGDKLRSALCGSVPGIVLMCA